MAFGVDRVGPLATTDCREWGDGLCVCGGVKLGCVLLVCECVCECVFPNPKSAVLFAILGGGYCFAFEGFGFSVFGAGPGLRTL